MAFKRFSTLKETPLHAALKAWYGGPDASYEVPVDGYVVDCVMDGLLVEIQTANFPAIRGKLESLLPNHRVRLVVWSRNSDVRQLCIFPTVGAGKAPPFRSAAMDRNPVSSGGLPQCLLLRLVMKSVAVTCTHLMPEHGIAPGGMSQAAGQAACR